MYLVASEEFQHILRILNTNVNGKQKIKGNGRRLANIACKKTDVDMNKRCDFCMAAILFPPSYNSSSISFSRKPIFSCSSHNPPKRQSLRRHHQFHEPNKDEVEGVSQKRVGGRGGRDEGSMSSAMRSFGAQKEKGLGHEIKEQQV